MSDYPWRRGWDENDPNRPCWTCGAAPEPGGHWGGQWWVSRHNFDHYNSPVTPQPGEWIVPAEPAPRRKQRQEWNRERPTDVLARIIKGER